MFKKCNIQEYFHGDVEFGIMTTFSQASDGKFMLRFFSVIFIHYTRVEQKDIFIYISCAFYKEQNRNKIIPDKNLFLKQTFLMI